MMMSMAPNAMTNSHVHTYTGRPRTPLGAPLAPPAAPPFSAWPGQVPPPGSSVPPGGGAPLHEPSRRPGLGLHGTLPSPALAEASPATATMLQHASNSRCCHWSRSRCSRSCRYWRSCRGSWPRPWPYPSPPGASRPWRRP